MLQLHGGRRDKLEISPNLWAGVGLVRGGAGTALVGDPADRRGAHQGISGARHRYLHHVRLSASRGSLSLRRAGVPAAVARAAPATRTPRRVNTGPFGETIANEQSSADQGLAVMSVIDSASAVRKLDVAARRQPDRNGSCRSRIIAGLAGSPASPADLAARSAGADRDVVAAGWQLLTLSGELPRNIWVSFWRAMRRLRHRRRHRLRLRASPTGCRSAPSKLIDTTLQMVRNIPHLALIPLVILWFGIDEAAKIFLVALGVFFPIYLNTQHGIRTVDPQLDRDGPHLRHVGVDVVPAGDLAGRAAVDLRRPALRARHHVADADRRRDHRRLVRHRLHGDAGARVPADRRRGAQHPDLRAARQARRQRLARLLERLRLSWHPAFQK